MKIKVIISFLFIFLLLIGCNNKEPVKKINDSKFIEYISEYTKGNISNQSNITVRLAKSVDLNNENISKNNIVNPVIFKISPSIKVNARWEDDRTIVFYTNNKLQRGKKYTAEIYLDKIFNDVSENLKVFNFNFKIIDQDIDIVLEETFFSEKDNALTQGIVCLIETADLIDEKKLEKAISISSKYKDYKTEWDHSIGNNKHKLFINNIKRESTDYLIAINLNGNEIEADKKIKKEIEVYGLMDFKYLSYKLIQSPEVYINVIFSMPIDAKQDTQGLIRIEGDSGYRTLIENNIIRIYPSSAKKEKIKLIVDKNLKDINGSKLNKDVELNITFIQEKPKIKWIKNRNGILPSTDGLILPFEAISLKAVDITVIEIYENNIVQFLQVNKDIKGNNEIKRVGRPVLYKTISLEDTNIKNLYEWNRFNINLVDIVKINPGSLYQIRINFRISNSLYSCSEENVKNNMLQDDSVKKENWDQQNEDSYWDYSEEYYNEYYNWENRENPCMPEYYGKKNEISANILASDIGIIAKGTDNGEVKVFISDIKSTEPLSNVNIEVYNYQQQIIGSGNTDAKGSASFKTDQVPFAIIAKRGKERGYLRIDDGNSLSMSSFDVGGLSSKKGLKGFIYGERGVWRPGDTMYLNFILEDKNKTLPLEHPVIFELKNPRNQIEKRIVTADNNHGIYNFNIATDSEAPTGYWLATVRVGGEVFEKSIKVETIKPNRLKIDLDFGKDKLTAIDKILKGKIESKWMHGAPAKKLKVEYDLLLTPSNASFKSYPGFIFDDPSAEFSAAPFNVFTGYLDENGAAYFDLDLPKTEKSRGALNAVFTGKVYEEGGDFSIDSLSIPYYPYESYVGIKMPSGDQARGMLLTDTDHNIDIAAIDANGQPLSKNNIKIDVYKLEWKWWWDKSEEDIANYLGKSYSNKYLSSTAAAVNGKGQWKLRINYPEWGRFFIRVYDPDSGHATGKIFYIDWPGWAGSSKKGELGGATMLSVFADKEEYKVGENANVTIPSSGQGRALVSIESGSKIIDSYWVQTKEGKTEFNFKITEQMTPNIYINITLIQPHAQVKNDLPIRLYGIIPVKVIDPNTKIEPEIIMADTLKPESNVTIKVKEKTGRAMAYTLVVVDEGLLDLTNFKTPQAWDIFYAKEALGVKSWDIYDDVIGAMADNFGPLLSIGGDGESETPKNQKANRFKPVVKNLGTFYLEKGKENSHTFEMPRYIGSVKTILVARYENAYGSATKVSAVKDNIMVLGTMPRVLGPNEKIKLPVNIFLLEDSNKTVNVTIKTEGQIEITGEAQKSVNFTKSGDQFVYFDLISKNKIGIAKVSIQAVSGNDKAAYDIELNVRPSNPNETEINNFFVEPNKTYKQKVNIFGIEGTNKLSLELSILPPINLSKNIDFLMQYPHGCVEQTTSSVFPQLYLDKVVELSKEQKDKIQNNILAGIERLKSFQSPDGGFSYWPGEAQSHDWASSYAGHFLIEAQKLGYLIPSGLLSQWEKYQTSLANKWNVNKYSQSDIVQAYRLYTLALLNKPALGAMNRMKELNDIDYRAKWRLAAAYAVIGKNDIALKLIYKQTTDVKEYLATSATYGSDLRDQAMILETLILLNQKAESFMLLKDICKKLGTSSWHSTQTTAYCLIAISNYFIKEKSGDSINCNYQFGEIKGNFNTNASIVLKEFKPANNEMIITNNGKQPVFIRIINQGIPLIGKEKDDEKTITMKVNYKTKDQAVINDISQIKQGTNFIIETTVFNSGTFGNLEEIALTQIVPSGWEIINTRLQDTDNYYNASKPDYIDIRDDRVFTYFDLKANETKTFKIMINAAYTGDFYLPGTLCEAMYNDVIYSKKTGKKVSVFK